MSARAWEEQPGLVDPKSYYEGFAEGEKSARKSELKIEFRQHDWIPGFAAFLDTPEPQGPAFCVLNLGSMLCAVACGDVDKAELPYFVAESMMHEIMHAIEKWAGTEFSEERVESLLEKYRVYAEAEREKENKPGSETSTNTP